jgi:glycerol-1-phosphate dehydrogenase [NAD(P)+]
MDGYTSVVAPLLLRGVKIHRAAVCPELIVCDLEIMRAAPLKMVISGVGDVLGKYIAHVDWQIGQIINGETYCPVCGAIVTDAVNRLIDNIEAIRQCSEAGIRILIEALLLAGVTIMIIGHTRAVASIEHNIVHYWDMMKLLDQQKQPSHGTAVGVSTLLVWPLYLRFAKENLSNLDLEDIKRRRMSREQREKWLLDSYQEEAATDIMRENQGDFLEWPEQERRIWTAQQRFDELADAIMQLPALERIQKAMRELGAPMLPGEIGIEPTLLNRSMHAAKDYRTRYSLFKLLDECGLLQLYLADYPLMNPDRAVINKFQ